MFVLATPGSGYLTSIEPGKKLCQGGAFQEASPPNRLTFTFAWGEEGKPGLEILVTLANAFDRLVEYSAVCEAVRGCKSRPIWPRYNTAAPFLRRYIDPLFRTSTRKDNPP